jgi:hypothetical protein
MAIVRHKSIRRKPMNVTAQTQGDSRFFWRQVRRERQVAPSLSMRAETNPLRRNTIRE